MVEELNVITFRGVRCVISVTRTAQAELEVDVASNICPALFEEALGVAVSAYYANRLKGNFITVSGREQFRLKLVEGFSAVTGMAALAGKLAGPDRPDSVYGSPRRALTLCPQLCMGIQPGARCHTRSADALSATLYGHYTQAIYRNRPIDRHPRHQSYLKTLASSARRIGQPVSRLGANAPVHTTSN